jgi:uncharacterized protein
MKEIEALGGWDKLMETLKKRLAEQKGRHQGGNKWIGTAARRPSAPTATTPKASASARTEPHRRAVKVWDKREFKDLDGDTELGTRNIKVALRRLRKFARTGARRTRSRRHHPLDREARLPRRQAGPERGTR